MLQKFISLGLIINHFLCIPYIYPYCSRTILSMYTCILYSLNYVLSQVASSFAQVANIVCNNLFIVSLKKAVYSCVVKKTNTV